MLNKSTTGTPGITLSGTSAENLYNLLFQLNWLNESMQADRSNVVLSTLLLNVDHVNQSHLHEAIETISRINMSSCVIKELLQSLDQEGGTQ